MNKALIILMILMMIPVAMAIDVTRTVSSTGLMTYTITGASGTYGVLIDDVMTGGCTLSDGTPRYSTIMTNPETTRNVQLSGTGSCTVTGNWFYGTTQQAAFSDTTFTISGAPVINNTNTTTPVSVCVDGATKACQSSEGCAGIQTCATNAWGSCVKTVSTCGVSAGNSFCSYMTWASFISPDNYCTFGPLIILGAAMAIYLIATRKKR